MTETRHGIDGRTRRRRVARTAGVVKAGLPSRRAADMLVAAVLGVVAIFGRTAIAAPAWKTAPPSPSREDEGALPFGWEVEGSSGQALESALIFVSNYYGYIAVAAVVGLLVLLPLIGRDRSDAAFDG